MNSHFMDFCQTGSKVRMDNINSRTLQDKTKWMVILLVSSTGSKLVTNNTNHFFSSRQTKWMVILCIFVNWFKSQWIIRDHGAGGLGGHVSPQYFLNFEELVRKSFLCPPPHLKIAPQSLIIPIICTLQDKQNEWSFYGFSSTTDSLKVRTNNTNNFYSSRQTKWVVILWVFINYR